MPLFKKISTFFANTQMLLGYLFYIYIIFILVSHPWPTIPKTKPQQMITLLSGEELGFVTFGSEFEPYKRYLPNSGKISFIMDYPFNPYAININQLYTAQSYLVPLILNPNAGEDISIIHCSNRDIAITRMQMTGYKMALPLADGKGLGVKGQ